MNSFDFSILHGVNQFSQVSSFFDNAVAVFQENNLLKAGAVMVIFWWFWFQEGDPSSQRVRRSQLIVAIMASIVALAVARGLANCLPFRVRPMYIAELAFKPPYGTDESFFVKWSSFPSDHAAMLSALAMGLWFVSRRVGGILLAYVLIVICAMRVYMGIHYPTDILVGAGIGIGCVVAFNHARLRDRMASPVLWLLDKYPSLFYAGLFLLTYQISDLFNAVRDLAKAMTHVL